MILLLYNLLKKKYIKKILLSKVIKTNLAPDKKCKSNNKNINEIIVIYLNYSCVVEQAPR